MSPARLSICIPTYGRDKLLWESVAPLVPQMEETDEIIIIDQNATALRVPEIMRNRGIKLHRCNPPSLTRARNLAISLARGTHILFLDDDIIPAQDLLPGMRRAAAARPGRIIAGAVDQEDAPPVQGVGRVDLKSGEVLTNYGSRNEMDVPFFAGCNFLLPRSCLLPQPCFNPWYRGSAQNEEIDYALRAAKRGLAISFCPRARIYHLKHRDGGCRSGEYVKNFPVDQVYNQGLFYGAHGRFSGICSFLKRMKDFTEFHSRRKTGKGHHVTKVLKAGLYLLRGFLRGVFCRFFM